MTEDFSELSLVEAGALIARRELSPVELTEAMLARIAALEPRLHAFVTVTAERARADARLAESASGDLPLNGVPIALKDLIDTAGIETAAGTVLSAVDLAPEAPVIGAGTGRFIAEEIARRFRRPYRSFESVAAATPSLGALVADIAPAAAVALLLAAERSRA